MKVRRYFRYRRVRVGDVATDGAQYFHDGAWHSYARHFAGHRYVDADMPSRQPVEQLPFIKVDCSIYVTPSHMGISMQAVIADDIETFEHR